MALLRSSGSNESSSTRSLTNATVSSSSLSDRLPSFAAMSSSSGIERSTDMLEGLRAGAGQLVIDRGLPSES